MHDTLRRLHGRAADQRHTIGRFRLNEALSQVPFGGRRGRACRRIVSLAGVQAVRRGPGRGCSRGRVPARVQRQAALLRYLAAVGRKAKQRHDQVHPHRKLPSRIPSLVLVAERMCLGSGTAGPVLVLAADGTGFLAVGLVRGRSAAGEPFGEPELEALAAFDRESLRLDVVQRAAQEVLALERHRDDFKHPLHGATWPGRGGDVSASSKSPLGRSTRVISQTARRSSGMAHRENVQTTVSKEASGESSPWGSASRRFTARSSCCARRLAMASIAGLRSIPVSRIPGG
jgi:hypothetical protein